MSVPTDRQYQTPGGCYCNETNTRQYQIPGMMYTNETVEKPDTILHNDPLIFGSAM